MKHDLDLNAKRPQSRFKSILQKMSPRTEKFTDQLSALWNHVYSDTRSLFRQEEAKHVHPRIDVLESRNIYDIRVDLPGVDANSIDLQTQGKTLLIKAKRTASETGDFRISHCEHKTDLYERGIRLWEDAVVEEKSATFSDGILSIRIPRKAA